VFVPSRPTVAGVPGQGLDTGWEVAEDPETAQGVHSKHSG
jgi:hypothetical protein